MKEDEALRFSRDVGDDVGRGSDLADSVETFSRDHDRRRYVSGFRGGPVAIPLGVHSRLEHSLVPMPAGAEIVGNRPPAVLRRPIEAAHDIEYPRSDGFVAAGRNEPR